MSAVLVAVFNDHAAAEGVRTRLVKDGFPTDRVELTSSQELGQVKLVPRQGVGAKLTEYFRKLFQSGGNGSGERWVPLFQRAVLDGKAVVAVQPRGDIETQTRATIAEPGRPHRAARRRPPESNARVRRNRDGDPDFSPGWEKSWPPRAPRIPRVFRSYPEPIALEVRSVPASLFFPRQ